MGQCIFVVLVLLTRHTVLSRSSRHRTHISIYHCDADNGTSELIDYFSVDTKIWTLFIDTTHLVILWNHRDRGQFAYIRLYGQGIHTPIRTLISTYIVLSLIQPQRGAIAIISQGYFITATGGGVYTRLFTMPAMHPINGTRVADSPVYHPCIWSAVQRGDYLLNPRITPLLLGDSLSSKTPPPKFSVWAGRHILCRMVLMSDMTSTRNICVLICRTIKQTPCLIQR